MTGSEVAHLPESVVAALSYVPDLAPGEWEQVRPLVQAVIGGIDIEQPAYARTTIRAVARFGVYCRSIGREATVDVALTPDLVESFAARGWLTAAKNKTGEAVVASDVARLRVIGRLLRPELGWPVTGEPGRKRPVRPPYSDAQCTGFAMTARSLHAERDGRTVRGVLGLGLGAGLAGGEIHRVRTDDVYTDDAGTTWVAVRGVDDTVNRSVPVATPWAGLLRSALATTVTAHGEFVVPVSRRSSGLSDELARIARRHPAVALDTHLLRTTWIAHRIRVGVPLHTLMAYAGLSSAETLVQIAGLLPTQPVSDAAVVLTRAVDA